MAIIREYHRKLSIGQMNEIKKNGNDSSLRGSHGKILRKNRIGSFVILIHLLNFIPCDRSTAFYDDRRYIIVLCIHTSLVLTEQLSSMSEDVSIFTSQWRQRR